jgi:anti-sigma factor RsiW
MTCRELVEFLMSYLEHELPEAQRAEFERHLEICPPCLAYLETYKETIRLGKAICQCPDDAVPHDVPEALVQAILAARRQSG